MVIRLSWRILRKTEKYLMWTRALETNIARISCEMNINESCKFILVGSSAKGTEFFYSNWLFLQWTIFAKCIGRYFRLNLCFVYHFPYLSFFMMFSFNFSIISLIHILLIYLKLCIHVDLVLFHVSTRYQRNWYNFQEY